MIKAIIFDLDDTLYLEEDYAFSGMDALGIWVNQRWGISGFSEELFRLWKVGIKTKTFDIALDNLGITLNQDQILEMVTFYREHKPQISLQPDAKWILDYLQKDYILGLITDGYEKVQQRKIDALGIKELIPNILITDTLGRDCWKPSQAPYEFMENKLILIGEQCVYVGDNVTKDFISANKRGWHTVQIIRSKKVHKDPKTIQKKFSAFHKIESFQELPNLLHS